MLLGLRSSQSPGSSERPPRGCARRGLGRNLRLPHSDVPCDPLHVLFHAITFKDDLRSGCSLHRFRHPFSRIRLQPRLVQIQSCSSHCVGLRRRIRRQRFRHCVLRDGLVPHLTLVPLHLARHRRVRLRGWRRPGRFPSRGLLPVLLGGCVHTLAWSGLHVLHARLVSRGRGVINGVVVGAVCGVVVGQVGVVAAAERFVHLGTLFGT
mmetsp:Transcript_5270/g.12548  ORF Transcript_5270/g.12548 Transcript_5270/m.12548 type:complete len:208 (-) Transcript_5270:157-780(-)